jgi:tetratricopeptide (TPR) repeat protein
MDQRKDIEIRRNIVEKGLMAAKEYVKANLRSFMYAGVALIAAAVLLVVGIIYYESRESAELSRFEQVLEGYRLFTNPEPGERAKMVGNTVKELNAIIDNSYWGYVNRFGYYVIGGLYYSEKMYSEARKYFLLFAGKNPRSFFAPLGLQQAARSSEYLGDFKESLKIYMELEKKYGDSAVADQILYDLGRVYQREGDIFKSREYFNKVISSFPRSQFAQKSRERLLLLGLSGGKG